MSLSGFILELCGRAADSTVHSMGTTYLALAGASIYPLSDLWIEFRDNGWDGVKQHWGRRLKYGVFIACGWWILLFCFHLVYKVPHDIRLEADNTPAPMLVKPSVGPPQIAYLRTVPVSTHNSQAVRYHFSFDSSPGWTNQVKRAIESDLNSFCVYLSDLGFEIPPKFPPLKLARLFGSGGKPPDQFFFIPAVWAMRDVDLESIMLDVRVVTDHDLGLARAALSDYLFSFYLRTNNTRLGDWKFRQRTVPIFATYFNWGYSKRKLSTYRSKPPSSLVAWADALWQMQVVFGKPYTDRVLHYAIKNINSADWGATADTNFDVYLFDFGVVQGEWQEGAQHIMETTEILHKYGIDVWIHQPKPPEVTQ